MDAQTAQLIIAAVALTILVMGLYATIKGSL